MKYKNRNKHKFKVKNKYNIINQLLFYFLHIPYSVYYSDIRWITMILGDINDIFGIQQKRFLGKQLF